MSPAEIIQESSRLGLLLTVRGDHLSIVPKKNLPHDFEAVLRRNKHDIIAYLRSAHPRDQTSDSMLPTESWAVGKYPPGTFDGVIADWEGKTRPHLAGWDFAGDPIYQGTEAEWAARFDRHKASSSDRTRTQEEQDWTNIARRVMEHEFDGADKSTRESLIIGLRGFQNPLCRRALERLQQTD